MAEPTQARSLFRGRWGVILTTAGAAIGLGNIWRFPYMMGEYGGAAFLVVYLVIVLAFGIPGLMAECALGRHTRRGPVGAFSSAAMPGAAVWSTVLLVTVIMAGSYYGVILAKVLHQFVRLTLGALGSTGAAGEQGFAASMAWVVITIGLSCVVIALGLRRGIERLSTLGLPFFFVLLVAMIVYVLRQDGALDGLRGFLRPRVEDLTAPTVMAALGQAFFSLGLGGTLMVMYGSYMRESDSIPHTAIGTALADVAAALLAGMLIVPAVFAVGVQLDSGPRLLFSVMPEVFERMPAGNLVGAIFFGSVFLVGLLSLVAAYEVAVGAAVDAWGWSRAKGAMAIGALELALAVPAVLVTKYIDLSDLIWGTTMMPVGSALAIVALAWCVGRAKTLEEIGRHSRLPVTPFLLYWIKYVLPIGIAAMLIYGWVDALRGVGEG